MHPELNNAIDDGAQMGLDDARVSDPVLTLGARGYSNSEFVSEALFPRVPCPASAARRIEFGKEDFLKLNLRRAPGAATQRIEFGHIGQPVSLHQNALEGITPREVQREAMAGAGVDVHMRTVDGTMAIIRLQTEIDAGETARKTSNYDATHVVTLAGNAQWSNDASNPTKNIMDGVEVVRKAIGRRPNVVVLGGEVFSRLIFHPKTLELARYQGLEAGNAEFFQRQWRIPRVVVGDAVYKDDAGDHDVWGDDVVLAYVAVGSVDRRQPSYGFTYHLPGHPFVEEPYTVRNRKSDAVPVTDEHSVEMVGKDAGYLIKDCLN